MFFFKIFPLLAALMLFLASCAAPEPAGPPVLLPRTDESTMRERAEVLATALAQTRMRGVWVDFEEYAPRTEEQAAAVIGKIAALGFNRIYCAITAAEQLDDPLECFIEAAAAKQIPIELAVRERNFVYTYHGNALIRVFRSSRETLPQIAHAIVDFNDSLPDEAKLAGLTVMVEPHIFTRANNDRPKDLLYAWEPDSFGIGLDNDMMMRRTFEMLDVIETTTPELPFTIGIADFYHELARDGKISRGTINDFLTLSVREARVLLENSGNKPSEALAVIANELADAETKQSILIGFSLAGHTSVATGAYRRRDWNDFTRSLEFLIGQWKNSPAFAGVVIGPFSLIELVLQEE